MFSNGSSNSIRSETVATMAVAADPDTAVGSGRGSS